MCLGPNENDYSKTCLQARTCPHPVDIGIGRLSTHLLYEIYQGPLPYDVFPSLEKFILAIMI